MTFLELPENTGALLSETPEQFIDNLLKVLGDDIFRQELGKKGGEHIRGNFSWKIIAKKLENYLKKIQNHE
jgi:glycosyltransferase involved in cell wall biosynthesis